MRGVERRAAATPLARIVSRATRGVDPVMIMGTGPIPASRAALEKAGWTIDDIDLIEAMKLRGASVRGRQDLGWDSDKVNVNGGAIALGPDWRFRRAGADNLAV